jgi:hypothetical protein
VAAGEGRDGSKALRITGGGKRGLAMQAPPAFPGRYRVTGWIKCEKIDAGQAGVLLEWIDAKGKWMRGDWAVHVSGTQDWKRFDAVLEAPPRTRSVHFDLITTEPTHGTVWFDQIEMTRLPSDMPAPQAPKIRAGTPPGQEGCLEVTWDPEQLTTGTCRMMIFCAPASDTEPPRMMPIAVADSEDGRVTLWSLESGKEYVISAAAVNADGKRSAAEPFVQAKVADRQAPRPGWASARLLPGARRVRVSWSPHVLDADVKALRVCVPGDRPDVPREIASRDVTALYGVPRPLYCSVPWANVDAALPEGADKIGVSCEDKAGNRSPIAWTDVQPARSPADAAEACALWIVPPTEHVRRDAPPPAQAPANLELLLMRGQAKGFQVVVRPGKDLPKAGLVFEPLVHEDGRSLIDSRWLAWHFVDYVRLEKNSIATPKQELVWPGPSDYPDPLSDETVRDLPASRNQPVYVRVTAPRDAKPGLYRGRGRIDSDRGSKEFAFTVRVSPVALPEAMQLKFVYWFSWEDACKQFGAEQFSADGWRVLARLGELMRVHHQNVAVVPWGLVRSWRTPGGTLTHDFREFDRFVETFQSQGVDRLFCLSHVGGRTTDAWECPTMSSSRFTARCLDTGEPEQLDVVGLLPALQDHLAAKGWLDRFSVHVADEPIPVNMASYCELAARVRQAAPQLRRIDAIHVPDLQGSLEIWVPQLNYFEQWLTRYRAAQRAGNELWFYIAWVPQGRYPNRMIDSYSIKSRVIHWLNAIYDTSGYLHWALNHWHIPLTSLNSPGDQYICWPSRRFIANSSLRYEAEREGLEDCELMFMVRDAMQKRGATRADAQQRVEAVARKAVRGIQDYTRSWFELEEVRRELLTQATALGLEKP